MTILTHRSDLTHRIAFGSAEAAERFRATTRDPDDWSPGDLQANGGTTPPTE